MSSHISRIAQQFASNPGSGNCANAQFFTWMALGFLRAALANLNRASALDPAAIDAMDTRRIENAIHQLEARERAQKAYA